MKNETRPAQNEGGLGRREFLLLTSSCAAATLALGPDLFAGVLSPRRDVAVGYLPIDAVTPGSDDLYSMVSADALTMSDGAFIRSGARVKLEGIGYGPGSRRTIVFSPHYLVDGTSDVAVDAWRFTRSTNAAGGPVAFRMPLDGDQRMRFSLVTASRVHRRDESEDPQEPLAVAFSLNNEPDVVKLSRGYYAVVPLHDGAAPPRWGATTLRRYQGNLLMHEMRDGVPVPVGREHFVLRFDYAEV